MKIITLAILLTGAFVLGIPAMTSAAAFAVPLTLRGGEPVTLIPSPRWARYALLLVLLALLTLTALLYGRAGLP